jgi:hypothetical protein
MRKGIVALVGMIIGLVLLVVSFLGPWYIINATGVFETEYSAGFYLTRLELQRNIGGQDVTLSMDYADAKMNIGDTAVNVQSFAMIETAMYLTLLALVTAVIAIMFMAAFVFQKGKPRTMKLGGGLFGVFTFLLTLLPALYFINTEFVENINGFWFSMTIFNIKITGGLGYAWYLMIVAAIIAVICAAAILLKKIRPADSSLEKVAPPGNT